MLETRIDRDKTQEAVAVISAIKELTPQEQKTMLVYMSGYRAGYQEGAAARPTT